MSRMRIIYPEQEPGRDRTAPMYNDQSREERRERDMRGTERRGYSNAG